MGIDYGWVPNDSVAQARQADLPSYLMQKGEPLKRDGSGNWTLDAGDFKIGCKAGRGWQCWKGSVDGVTHGNPIDFVMRYYCLGFKDAVEELAGCSLVTQCSAPEAPKDIEVRLCKESAKARSYLCKDRGLDRLIVDGLIGAGRVRQSEEYSNVVFVVLDELGEYKGYEMRGTSPARFHRSVTEGGWPFCVCVKPSPGEPPRGAYVFEAAIDALSFWTIYECKLENVLLASAHGITNTEKCVNVLKKAYGLTDAQICLCLDNDEAGSAFMGRNPQWRSLRVKDPFKDWNESLVNANARRAQQASAGESAGLETQDEASAGESAGSETQDEASAGESAGLETQDEASAGESAGSETQDEASAGESAGLARQDESDPKDELKSLELEKNFP